MSKQIEDSEILSLFSNEKTKEKAFELLMKKYKTDIYYATRRVVTSHEDANDVTQNVLLKIWRYLNTFRGESSLRTWILRICMNESLNFIAQRKKLLNLYDDDYATYTLKTAAEERHVSSDKIESLLREAIARLPDKQRTVFTLRYFNETPYEELSKILDTSVGALKASYHFAVKKVEEFLSKH
ncbi:sigma-70 family RNA polymerase sigma factor [Bacteroidales bacterium OttesenSCG-928-E04]|nr:sigma-70 family RNA polymerase sigma factor [Bacteroidales bacterium OttesenSCG-928-E04]MDL2326566.1 sigma-70 family RNA polymerase sigma factor [Bacteroidales bacterium OttesenSCG-928-A14]